MSVGTGGERSRKRRKVEAATPFNSASITGSNQLQQLLQFSQSSLPEDIKAAVDRLTEFLSNLINEDSPEQTRQLKALKKYCDEQSSVSHDQVDFPDLLSAWSNASQSNAEAVLSAIPRALTQFFETISSDVEFRDFGISLCHSLLKRDQLRIFDRCLSSPRSKEYIITPCLQLLTQIISFDGGALASNVFSRRDFLYRRLDGILSQTPATVAKSTSATAQQASLEFILANLKYLDSASKSEFIMHGKTIFLAVRNLSNLPVSVVINALKSLEKSIIGDGNLSKQTKIRSFHSGVLSALAKLYDYKTEENGDPSVEVRDALHHLLLQVCTISNGVLIAQSGWYPAGMNPEILGQDENMIDLGLDSPFYFDDYAEKVPVKNGALSTFIQTLRPESDVQQADLIVAVFNAAAELVADYFTKKQKFLVPPGDDPKWRGQFAFLFSVVQLPVPRNCGWDEKLPLNPPPLSIVIESILPRPLDRATIGKCLRMNEEIMTISATRLLTVAFEKLDSVLKVFEKATAQSHLWEQASRKLISLFVERIPPLQDVVTALQKLENENEQVRTAVLECIVAYHTILPSITAGSKFDFGLLLSKGLQSLESDTLDTATKDLVLGQVAHLLQIAHASSATKWFHKHASGDVSLIVQLLRRYVQDSDKPVTKEALLILKGVLTNKGILNTNVRSINALILSLTATKKWQPELVTYQFLDNCMSRTVQRPVKYLDQLEQAQQLLSDSKQLSLLPCCVSEQWMHLLKKENKKGIKNVAEWVARFFSALDSAGENYRVMTHFQEEMLRQCDGNGNGNEKAKEMLEKAFQKQRKRRVVLPEEHLDEAVMEEAEVAEDGAEQRQHTDLDLAAENFPPSPAIPTSLAGLDRWTKPDFESEIQTGRLANLIHCLISPEPEIRLQAFHILQHIIHAVQQSTYAEKTQLYLLLGELYETIKINGLSNSTSTATAPSSSIVAELAIHFLPIVSDPSCPFYRKTNTFLLRAPHWSVSHILPYWLKETFLTEPEIDDPDIPASFQQGAGGGGNVNAQALEIEHFLDLLVRSLRSEADMELFRRAQVFTRLFSHYLSPVCTKSVRKKILMLVHLATRTKGGSDTLITRTGVREWLSIAKTLRGHSGHGVAGFGKTDDEMVRLAEAVGAQVVRTCDAEAIGRWEAERRMFREVEHRVEAHGKAGSAGESGKQDLVDKVHEAGANGGSGKDESESESDSDSDSDSQSQSQSESETKTSSGTEN